MKILITAGPTREAIDPVRYISNRSSGKMGYAVAEAAVSRGHEVTLISGPVNISAPCVEECVPVLSALEMYEAVADRIEEMDAAVFCAAVADYRVEKIEHQKIKKDEDTLTLHLVKTRDILGSTRDVFRFRGTLVGFAAETTDVEKNARAKMEKKGCDFMVANDVSRQDIGFDQDDNEVRIFFRDGSEAPGLGVQSKREIGEKLIELIEVAAAKSE